MTAAFAAAMKKLSLLGQNPSHLTDCSDVIPIPKPVTGQAHLPAGSTLKDIQASVGKKMLNTLVLGYADHGMLSASASRSQLSQQTLALPPASLLCKWP